jgi:hypothetical protein
LVTRTLFRSLLASAALAAASLSARPASAYEEQWHFGGGVGAAKFMRIDSPYAPAVGVHAAYDVSDMFDFRLELMGSQHAFTDSEKTRFYSAAVGIMYKIDVLEWVPYVGITGGYYAFDGRVWPRSLKQHELGMSIPLGLDYTISRSFGVGAQIRYHGFLSDPMNSLTDAPFFTALIRAEYRAGW